MKRSDLLSANLTEDKNVATIVTNTLAKDIKSLKKAKRDLEDEVEELEDQLEERLSSQSPLDKSVVEVLYSNLLDLKASLKLYDSFESEYLK